MLRRLVEVGPRGVAVRSLGADRAGEMRITRFLRNASVSAAEMVATACARTKQRVRGLHVLAIQDTTSLRDDGAGRSLNAHPTIAVEAESGAPLGLVAGELFETKGGASADRSRRAFADKASHRWLRSAEAAAGLREAGALCVTVVADREADIYELFAQKPVGTELLVRARHDRALAEGGLAFAALAAGAEAGRISVDLPAAPGRKARTALFALRFRAVEIKRPTLLHAKALPETVNVRLVEAREIDPPDGQAGALWRLVTTHAVESFEDARFIAGLYRRRWTIEEMFRTLKTRGFDIERVAIDEAPFEKLCAAALVAAMCVMQLVAERDGAQARPLEDVFHPDEAAALEAVSQTLEGKTARQKNPHAKATLAFAAWVCARLGGWTGYYGKPGPVVMLRGLHQFRAMQNGWSLAHNV